MTNVPMSLLQPAINENVSTYIHAASDVSGMPLPNTKDGDILDVYLHLGAHRCANQTFFNYLKANSLNLARRRLTVWTPRRTRDGLMRGLVRSPEKITVEDERNALRSIGRMRIELDRLEKSGCRGLLISDAALLGDIRENLSSVTLYPLLQERLMRLAPIFADRPLRIGVMIRSFESFWTSSMAHQMSMGQPAPDPNKLDYLTTQPRHWRHVLRDIKAALPNGDLCVLPFERGAGRPEWVINRLSGENMPPAERGPIWDARSGDVKQLNDVLAQAGHAPLAINHVHSGLRWMPFDADHQSVLRAEYQRDLTWLRAGGEGMVNYIGGRKTPRFLPKKAANE